MGIIYLKRRERYSGGQHDFQSVSCVGVMFYFVQMGIVLNTRNQKKNSGFNGFQLSVKQFTEKGYKISRVFWGKPGFSEAKRLGNHYIKQLKIRGNLYYKWFSRDLRVRLVGQINSKEQKRVGKAWYFVVKIKDGKNVRHDRVFVTRFQMKLWY